MPGIDQHRIRLAGQDLVDLIAERVAVDGGHAEVDHFHRVAGHHVLEGVVEHAGKRSVVPVRKAGRGGLAEHEDSKTVGRFGEEKAVGRWRRQH